MLKKGKKWGQEDGDIKRHDWRSETKVKGRTLDAGRKKAYKNENEKKSQGGDRVRGRLPCESGKGVEGEGEEGKGERGGE